MVLFLMKRKSLDNLSVWKLKKQRKPLVLNGARQVGKTFAIRQFGQLQFEKNHIFNFEKEPEIHSIFEQNKSPTKIIEALSVYKKDKIDVAKDLIFFDEIQTCPQAITALKYFSEDLPQSYICSAGSLLGLHLGEASFPVGKVELINIYPMDWQEFLEAVGDLEMYTKYIESPNEAFHQHLWSRWVDYLIVGGLPEVVQKYIDTDSDSTGFTDRFTQIRTIQENLILGYLADMAKHAGKENSMLLDRLLHRVAEQIGQDSSKKFQFKGVFPGKRSYEDFVGPIEWLKKAGLIYQVPTIDSARIPLSVCKKENAFKLFVFDIGLSNVLARVPAESLRTYDFSHKGFIAESFVLQEMVAITKKVDLFYAYKNGQSEVEFLTDYKGQLLPIEVKAGINLKSKSLAVFLQKYRPPKAIRLSKVLANKKNTEKILNDFPIFQIGDLIKTS